MIISIIIRYSCEFKTHYNMDDYHARIHRFSTLESRRTAGGRHPGSRLFCPPGWTEYKSFTNRQDS